MKRGQGCLPFIVCDDDELEVFLLPPGQHDVTQGLRKAATVVCIQVGGGLIQSQDATVQAEGFSQCQPNDEAGQHLHNIYRTESGVD